MFLITFSCVVFCAFLPTPLCIYIFKHCQPHSCTLNCLPLTHSVLDDICHKLLYWHVWLFPCFCPSFCPYSLSHPPYLAGNQQDSLVLFKVKRVLPCKLKRLKSILLVTATVSIKLSWMNNVFVLLKNNKQYILRSHYFWNFLYILLVVGKQKCFLWTVWMDFSNIQYFFSFLPFHCGSAACQGKGCQ